MSTTQQLPRTENIAHEATHILKTVILLERSYSSSYLVRLLQADERYKFRKVAHQQIETYGVLEDLPFSRIEDIIYYLTTQGLLKVENALYGTIALTDEGETYLQAPSDMEVERATLFRGWAQIQLSIALRTIRKEAAEAGGRQPFELYTNFVLDTLVRQMPESIDSLNEVPGMRSLNMPVKEQILVEIQQIRGLIERDEASGGLLSKAYSPGHRKIRELFEAEFSIGEIARRRNLQPGTVRKYLMQMHEAGVMNLKPWIEREVDGSTLEKGAEYFRAAKSPKLEEAKQVLGFDYDTLHLCRAYAVEVNEPSLLYA